MDSLYLIEYSYRSLQFINFLEQSLNSWKEVPETNEMKKKLTMQEKQMIFRKINDNNLIEYQKFENSVEMPKSGKVDSQKVDFIKKWAKSNNIKYSNFNFEEIYYISNQIYNFYIKKLFKLKEEKNSVLNLVFPQLIKSLFSSFQILNELMSIFLKEKNAEKNRFTDLILKTEEDEKKYKEEFNDLKNDNEQYKNKIGNLRSKINELLEERNKLKKNLEENRNNNDNIEELKKKYILTLDLNNSLIIENQNFELELNWLKNEIEIGKQERQALEKKLENEENERKALEKKLENERKALEKKLENERKALEKKLENEENERQEKLKIKNNEIIKVIEDNNKKLLQKISEIILE
jgi:predicted  nucleic acid-binding Zn-ribbon protein